MIQNIVMVVCFVAAVDGCALYSLKRANIRPLTAKVIWAAVILLMPAVGALAFFFLRPSCCHAGQGVLDDDAPQSMESVGSSPASSCQSASPASASGASGEPTTPPATTEVELGLGKSPAGQSPANNKWMFAPSS